MKYIFKKIFIFNLFLKKKHYLQNLSTNEQNQVEAQMQNVGIDTKSVAQPSLKRAKSSYTINHFSSNSNQNFVNLVILRVNFFL